MVAHQPDAQPGKRIDAFIDADVAFGECWPADTTKTIAAGNEIASNLATVVVLHELYRWLVRIQVAHAHVGNFKQQWSRCARSGRDEIFYHLVLPR